MSLVRRAQSGYFSHWRCLRSAIPSWVCRSHQRQKIFQINLAMYYFIDYKPLDVMRGGVPFREILQTFRRFLGGVHFDFAFAPLLRKLSARK